MKKHDRMLLFGVFNRADISWIHDTTHQYFRAQISPTSVDAFFDIIRFCNLRQLSGNLNYRNVQLDLIF